MKKLFLLLLMAVAAVSAWGQEKEQYFVDSYNEEHYKSKSLKQRYIGFLFGNDENELPEFGFLGYINREVLSIYDEERGLIIKLEWLRQPQVRERFQKDVLSVKKRLEGKDFHNAGVYRGFNMECCLSVYGKGENYTFAKL